MESEAERAAFYQAHRDDPDVWEQPKRPRRRPGPPKKLSDTITVRFSVEETDLIRREAERTDSNYSEVIRKAVRALAQPAGSQIGTFTSLFSAGTIAPGRPSDLELEGSETLVSSTGSLAHIK